MNPASKYKVLVIGEHFNIPSMPDLPADGEGPLTAFATTRFVEATTPLHAAKNAFALIRADLHVHHVPVPGAVAPPTLTVARLYEIPSFDGYPVPGAGFTFVHRFVPPSLLSRLGTFLREFWYQCGGTRPWSHSELF